SLKDKYFKI
ncbi:hypothetical protein EC950183_3475, partial [Escherichia coli 95.0183]